MIYNQGYETDYFRWGLLYFILWKFPTSSAVPDNISNWLQYQIVTALSNVTNSYFYLRALYRRSRFYNVPYFLPNHCLRWFFLWNSWFYDSQNVNRQLIICKQEAICSQFVIFILYCNNWELAELLITLMWITLHIYLLYSCNSQV